MGVVGIWTTTHHDQGMVVLAATCDLPLTLRPNQMTLSVRPTLLIVIDIH